VAEPDDVVLEVPLLALEASTDGPRAVGIVERARIGPAQVDDRDLVEVVALVDRAALVRALERGLRRGKGSMSMSTPPTFAFRSTNCAGVICAFSSAFRPNCTPSSPSGSPANPYPAACSCGVHSSSGRGPKTLIM
jgi:hypothetical protein